MDYSKKDLRNNNDNLLRRTQRQLDKVNENSLAIQESNLSLNKSSINNFFSESSIDVPSSDEITFQPKQTRLSLRHIRGGRQ